MKKIPNLFIVGSAKAGTTSVYDFFSKHTNIFVPTLKEMNFMAFEDAAPSMEGAGDKDYSVAWSIRDINEYVKQYSNWREEPWALDCSPSYLYFDSVPDRIKKYSPNAKIIIILRNPVDCAFSMYSMMRRDGRETEKMFEVAFSKSKERLLKGWEWAWDYAGCFMFYEQVKRYIECFDGENICIINYDILRDNPDLFTEKLYAFLSLKPNNLSLGAIRTNAAPTRIEMMNKNPLFFRINRLLTRITEYFHIDIFSKILISYKNRPAFRLKDREKEYFANYYLEDIKKLEGLLGWNLSAWKIDEQV